MSISTWNNINRNVDSSINADGSDFVSSSRVIIYAKKSGSGGTFKPIGVLQGWSFSEQRQMDEIFEIGSDRKYVIPGRTAGGINISRILINGMDLTNVLHDSSSGQATIRTLKDIASPIDLIFVAYSNAKDGKPAEEIFQRYFVGCWITARQESLSAGQTIVAESCSITYTDVLTTEGKNLR